MNNNPLLEEDFNFFNDLETLPLTDDAFECSEEAFNQFFEKIFQNPNELSNQPDDMPPFVKKLFEKALEEKTINYHFKNLLLGKKIEDTSSQSFILGPEQAFEWLESFLTFPSKQPALIIFSRIDVRLLFSNKFFTQPSFGLSLLKKVLSTENVQVAKIMWTDNPNLQRYFNGKPIHLYSQAPTDQHIISFSECIEHFKLALNSRSNMIIKSMWDNNSELRNYFFGKTVNSLDESIANFKLVLSSQYKNIIMAIWENHLELRHYFLNVIMNSLVDSICFFKLLLSSHCKEIIEVIWSSNLKLQKYFGGEAVSLGDGTDIILTRIPFSDWIINFKTILSSRCKEIIKIIWDGNPKLRDYFIGKEIDVERESGSYKEKISFYECVCNFKSSLSSQYIEIIKFIWDNNSKLRDYFLGKPINLGTELKPYYIESSFFESLNNFKSVLSSKCVEVSIAIWTEHKNLRKYLSGEVVNIGTEKNPKYQKISLIECISYFRPALSAKNRKIIKSIWKDNKELQNYFGEKNFNMKFSLDESIENFKSALSSRFKPLIKKIWASNKKLKDYFCGIEINLGTESEKNYQKISLSECVTYFKHVLSSCSKEIIKIMWDSNPALQIYFSGKLNLNSSENLDDQKISWADCVINFKSVLSSQHAGIITSIWNNNLLLQNYFTGKQINVGTTASPIYCQVSPAEQISNFKSLLSGHCKEIIRAVWNDNLKFRNYFSGNLTNLGTKEKPDRQKILLTEAVDNFKSALSAHCEEIAKWIWTENLQLKEYFSGKEINLDSGMQKISLTECVANFKSALSSHCQDIIKAMWNGNAQLKDYFCGKEVNTRTNLNPKIQKISFANCLVNFKSALTSQCETIIREMWNDIIKPNFNQLTEKEKIQLGQKILSSTSCGKGEFITESLSHFEDDILETIRENIEPKKNTLLTPYKQNQLDSIQKALNKKNNEAETTSDEESKHEVSRPRKKRKKNSTVVTLTFENFKQSIKKLLKDYSVEEMDKKQIVLNQVENFSDLQEYVKHNKEETNTLGIKAIRKNRRNEKYTLYLFDKEKIKQLFTETQIRPPVLSPLFTLNSSPLFWQASYNDIEEQENSNHLKRKEPMDGFSPPT